MVGEIKKAKDEARAEGEAQFFANVPCRRGHNANRFTASGQCVACDRMRYRANAKARIQQMRAWRASNPDAVRAACKRWKDANPDACRNLSIKRRSLKAASGSGYTVNQVRKIHAAQGGRCAGCLKPVTSYHADHVVPLALGGAHDISNIQVLCAPCNLSKHKKDPIAWANENGRLI